MSHNRRAPKLLAYLLAVPVFALVYLAAFATRLATVLRPAAATLLGISVIGSTYAGEAVRRAPAKPIRAVAALSLAVVLVAPAVTQPPVAAASNPQQAVVDLAMSTIGSDYRFGAEGPEKFDCSGLVYWAFKQAGELPRIGGYRMGATSYLRWFVARGRFSHDEADARPGDLVVWGDGHHIGIYIGPNRAVSALNPRLGVRLHDLKIPHRPSQYLLVNWGTNDGGGGGGGDNGGGGNNGGGNNPPPEPTPAPTPDEGDSGGNGASNGSTDFAPPDNGNAEPTPAPTEAPATPEPPVLQPPPDVSVAAGHAISASAIGTLPTATRSNRPPAGFNGVAIATVNLRESPDVTSRILGWVGSGGFVRIIGKSYSPQGNLYYQVETPSGSSGWVYSRWVLNTP
jgi:cell wall-associated NlpC family hydrolase